MTWHPEWNYTISPDRQAEAIIVEWSLTQLLGAASNTLYDL